MNNLNNVFLTNMQAILGDNYNEFLESLNRPNEKAVYVNENKISVEQFKNCADFSLSQIPYEKSGFYVDNIKLGRHPLHHAGAFYIQEPSSMFTVNSYNFKGDERVLDLCAAPGGKSIQIANRIPNGLLVSNEIDKVRSSVLFSNIERMGLKNVIVTNDTPENVCKAYANSFDVCLVDAPCSGEGMFRKGEDMLSSWNPSLNEMCSLRQKEILTHANNALKQNGILIYSTCTYSPLENEDIVNWLIDEYGYKLLPIKHNFSCGINMPEAARLYPHVVKGEGQFVAVLQKQQENILCPNSLAKLQKCSLASKFIKEEFNLNLNCYNFKNFAYYVKDVNFIKKGVNYVSLGVKVCDLVSKTIQPFHNLFTAFGNEIGKFVNVKSSSAEALKYLRGETLETSLSDGYGVVFIDGCAVGGFKMSKGKFKNYYPKGLRNF